MADNDPVQNIEIFNEAFARLTMLEFFVEVMFAREWSMMSQEDIEIASAALLDRFANLFPHIEDDPEVSKISRRSAAMAENLVYKINLRAEEIRKS